ncbi:isoprenoid synthase domain-containing protein [Daedaleopsis nitida]|nr:isoprenoid synthase domain-containing protein [Daedaleopsis nitida]
MNGVKQLKSFPSHFRLKDLIAISSPVFELKLNPHQEEAARATNDWFDRRDVYHSLKKKRFLSHRFDAYAGMSFPDADVPHLETCIAFFLWAVSFDDLSDEGALQSKPDAVQVGVDISMEVLRNPDAPPPSFPYAAMLHDIWRRFRSTASPGACNRFFRAVEKCRELDELAGGASAETGRLMNSLPLKILSSSVGELLAAPSWKKEQADGDFQNLVFCIMIERDCDLQTAVDVLTDMQAQRVADYVRYKAQLPSFGPEVDTELARYNAAIEQYTQGTVVWYYQSTRYFRGQDVLFKPAVVVPVYEQTIPAADQPGLPIAQSAVVEPPSLHPRMQLQVAAMQRSCASPPFLVCPVSLSAIDYLRRV